MPQDAPWDEIACLYRDLTIPVAELAKRFGLTRQELINGAVAREWPTRGALRLEARAGRVDAAVQEDAPEAGLKDSRTTPPAARKQTVDKTGRTGRPAKASGVGRGANPLGLVKRIYNTIGKELSKLEEHAGASSQDRERASRALSQMVSSLEKAHEMQREITKEQDRKDAQGKNKEALKNAEELRREIADRIERLQRQRAPAK